MKLEALYVLSRPSISISDAVWSQPSETRTNTRFQASPKIAVSLSLSQKGTMLINLTLIILEISESPESKEAPL